jgi:quinoprotein glucose dehydrogenase
MAAPPLPARHRSRSIRGIRSIRSVGGALLSLAAACAPAAFAQGADWPAYGGAPGGGQYSPLAAIHKGNVRQLQPAWTYRTGELGEGLARAGKLTFEANPVVAEGKLFAITATSIVIALDPATGRALWRHDPQVDRTARYGELAARGVASWIDRQAQPGAPCRHTIFAGTLDARLMALDGATGQPCPRFAQQGFASLRDGIRMHDAASYLVTSPPAIAGDVVVVGSAIGDNRAQQLEEGIVRGYDARTGRLLWAWDPVPRAAANPADWDAAQARSTGAANGWAPISADAARGLVFVPTSSPSPDFYGGGRRGSNRDANSVVAIRAATGEVAWRRQLVHHDLWDYDLASQPVLADLVVEGRKRAVVIQGTKMGFVFVLDRDTGEFVFPVEEVAVPGSDVPGEQASPTQPFPEPLLRLADTTPVTPERAWGFTPLDRYACRRKIAALRSGGIFTPPSIGGTLMNPGYAGGINWSGLAFDPLRQRLYAPVLQLPMVVTLLPRAAEPGAPTPAQRKEHPDSEFARMAGTPYALRREPLLSPFGAPCAAPPWGKMVAIDLVGRKRLWERPIGTTAEIAPIAMDLGVPFMGGAIVTGGGLVFMAGTTDNVFRAYDQDTGNVLWEFKLPAGGNATPATYSVDGRQFVVIAAGGHGGLGTRRGDHLIAFSLPHAAAR